MRQSLSLIRLWLLVVIASSFIYASLHKRDYEVNDYFAIELDPAVDPQLIAIRFNLNHHGQIGQLQDHHLYSLPKERSSIIPRDQDLASKWESYTLFRRTSAHSKRGIDDSFFHGVRFLQKQELRQRVKRGPIPLPPNYGMSDASSLYDGLEDIKDPLFRDQWHLINPVERHDINITGVWKSGVTGKNVSVALIDDGLDMDSDDLKENFYAQGSHDFNDHTDLPRPRLSDDTHGTRCAGQIAAIRNDVCGVGIAYEAKVSGLRILSKPVSDVDEAEALNYDYHNNHIYSCSWGPTDDGRSAEAPKGIVWRAILNGIEKGRNGLGSIFVFASGNGGGNGDNCNFDGYTNSIYSVTVGAIDRKGLHPYYSEECSALMVVTYSSGSGSYIHTTDVGKNSCTEHHGGTSAAAPIAAGIFALVLSIRPDLTWRDIQHLCVQTAVKLNDNDEDWSQTYAGRHFNHKYGYGKLDAYAIVEAARTFEKVKKQAWVEEPYTQVNLPIPFGAEGVTSTINITADQLKGANFEKLEHVTVTVNIAHQRRGDIEVDLISPHNIVSQLASARLLDLHAGGLEDWTFMTVKHWGEDPVGTWTLKVRDQNNILYTGEFINWRLSLWGESIDESKAITYPLDPHPATGTPNDNTNKPAASTTTSSLSPTPTPDSSKDNESSEVIPEQGQKEVNKTEIQNNNNKNTTAANQGDPDDPLLGSLMHLKSINPLWVGLIIAFMIMFAVGGWLYYAGRSGRWPFTQAVLTKGTKGVGDYEFEILHDADDDDDMDPEDHAYVRSGGDRAPLMSERERAESKTPTDKGKGKDKERIDSTK